MDWIRITYLTLLLLFGSGLLHAQPLNEAYFFTDSNGIINYGVEAIGDEFFIGGHTISPSSAPYVYPFPTNTATITWSIYDVKGSKLLGGELNSSTGTEEINTSKLATGSYIIKLKSANQQEQLRFVKH